MTMVFGAFSNKYKIQVGPALEASSSIKHLVCFYVIVDFGFEVIYSTFKSLIVQFTYTTHHHQKTPFHLMHVMYRQIDRLLTLFLISATCGVISCAAPPPLALAPTRIVIFLAQLPSQLMFVVLRVDQICNVHQSAFAPFYEV